MKKMLHLKQSTFKMRTRIISSYEDRGFGGFGGPELHDFLGLDLIVSPVADYGRPGLCD